MKKVGKKQGLFSNTFCQSVTDLVLHQQIFFKAFKYLNGMQIILTQSGGIAGKKLTASLNSTLTDKEWKILIDTIKINAAEKSNKRDAFSYTLQKNDEEATKTRIDISTIPVAYNDLFKKLFDGLKPSQ